MAAAARQGGDATRSRAGHDDDRAVQRCRGDAHQALRTPGGRSRRVRERGRPDPRHHRGHGGVRAGVGHRHRPGRRADHRPHLRRRRHARRARRIPARVPRRADRTDHPAVRPDQPAVQPAGQRSDRAGEIRPGLRDTGFEAAHYRTARGLSAVRPRTWQRVGAAGRVRPGSGSGTRPPARYRCRRWSRSRCPRRNAAATRGYCARSVSVPRPGR